MSEKILIGMSGGVDSSVAAKILVDRGYEVIGVTIKMYDDPNDRSFEKSVADARSVAEKIGIKHYVADFSDDFKDKVIDNFINCYLDGATPNPCVQCNKFIKFGRMLEMADELGCSKVSTGHYAKIGKNSENGRYCLMRSFDRAKDQTYFLYTLSQEQLSRAVFPLYDTEKAHVRRVAESIGLKVYDKPDSQDVCFIKNCHYTDFIHRYTNEGRTHGNFVDMDGNPIGEHSGIINYTVGQRKGLGVTFNKPMYVLGKNRIENTVILGDNKDLFSNGLIADNVNISAYDKITEPMKISAKVRHSMTENPAVLTILSDGRAKVEFENPQRAVTQGQSAVFYKDDMCIGGGTITEAF